MSQAPAITTFAVVLVLASAGLHTAWNMVLKKVEDKGSFNAWLLLGCAVWGAPIALYLWLRGPSPPPLAMALAFTTSVLWLAYYELLGRSYERGDLSVAYPVIRGVSPVAAAFFGYFLGERATGWGAAGIVCIVVAVWLLSGRPLKLSELKGHNVAEPIAVGIISALYSAIDDRGVSLCTPFLYIWLAIVPAAVWVSALAAKRIGWRGLWEFGQTRRFEIAWASFADYAAYALVLVALTQAQVMYVVPLRASAVLFSVLVGALHLGERDLGPRLIWGLVMIAGILMLSCGG